MKNSRVLPSAIYLPPPPRARAAIATFCLAIAFVFSLAPFARAQWQHVRLKSFGYADRLGEHPQGAVILGKDGMLYGTCAQGGLENGGVIFKADPVGNGIQVIHHFDLPPADGIRPSAALLEASDGLLYGTTLYGGGGNGTVFKIGKDGSGYALLHQFGAYSNNDGSLPMAGLIEGRDGALYGTTASGGTNSSGTIFKLNKDGTGYEVLHEFNIDEGAFPVANLLQGSDGALYGTTAGGNDNSGTVFRINPDGSGFETLHRFALAAEDGSAPYAGLTESRTGFLYGTTSGGGAWGGGTVFRMKMDGSHYRVIHHFNGNGGKAGIEPSSPLVAAQDGFFYGTTADGGPSNAGSLYRIDANGERYRVMRQLGVHPDEGQNPAGGLAWDGRENFYGATTRGGRTRLGTVFKITAGGSFQTLWNFSAAGGDGTIPRGPLVRDERGTLYGTTERGGVANLGVVFSIGPDGNDYRIRWSFPGGLLGDQSYGVTLDRSNGTLYGATEGGGVGDRGTVFRLNTNGTYKLLHLFKGSPDDGERPVGGLLEGSDGILYGTASQGGGGGGGIVFSVGKNGHGYRALAEFSSSSGFGPEAKLIEGREGALYGTCRFGNIFQAGGSIFKLNKDGSGFQVLHNFHVAAGDGGDPGSALLEGSDGVLYGTTMEGFSNSGGTVFRINKDGSGYTVLHTFPGSLPMFAALSTGLVESPDGALYGVTALGEGSGDAGTVFKMNKDGSGFELICEFSNLSTTNRLKGTFPEGGLLQTPDGSLYSTTAFGGDLDGGTVFKLVPVP